MDIHERLKTARERRGYVSATKAAEAMGIPYGTYAGHENGSRGIKLPDIARYAEFYRIPVVWLQFGTGMSPFKSVSSLSERLFAIRGKRSQTEFADIFGVSAQAISQWENGHTEPSRENLEKLCAHDGLNLTWLITGKEPETSVDQSNLPHEKNITGSIEPITMRVEAPLGARDLPVFAAVEGGDGELVVSTEPVDMVPRPWYMGQVKDGYAVIVTGESMVPAYDPGDMAIVNPRLPYMRGKVHIFTCESDNSHFRASIKVLVKVTETEWIVEQYNPPKTYALPRSVWTHARRVVGKYNG